MRLTYTPSKHYICTVSFAFIFPPLTPLHLYLIRYKQIKVYYFNFQNKNAVLKKGFSFSQFSFYWLQAAATHYVCNIKTELQVSLCWFIYKNLLYLIRLMFIRMSGRISWAIYFCYVINCMFFIEPFKFVGKNIEVGLRILVITALTAISPYTSKMSLGGLCFEYVEYVSVSSGNKNSFK